jgi:hypothetical protein
MARPGNLAALACRIPLTCQRDMPRVIVFPNPSGGIFPRLGWDRSLLYQVTHSMVAMVTSVTLSHGPSRLPRYRHFQCIVDQLGPQRIHDLPADRYPGKQIENKRGLRKATRRPGVVMSATRRRFGARR